MSWPKVELIFHDSDNICYVQTPTTLVSATWTIMGYTVIQGKITLMMFAS